MKFSVAVIALVAGIASASPQILSSRVTITRTVTRTAPTAPARTYTQVQQANSCGNDAMPFCCSGAPDGGYSTCFAMNASSQCSQTVVCCNANNSVQRCIGNANIVQASQGDMFPSSSSSSDSSSSSSSSTTSV